MAKEAKQLGKNYLIKSGSHYSGEIGDCVEVMQSKKHSQVMLKLDLTSGMIWFNENELEEF